MASHVPNTAAYINENGFSYFRVPSVDRVVVARLRLKRFHCGNAHYNYIRLRSSRDTVPDKPTVTNTDDSPRM